VKRKTKATPPKRAPFKQRLQKVLLDDAARLREVGTSEEPLLDDEAREHRKQLPHMALLLEHWARELDQDDITLADLYTVADALYAGMRIGFRLVRLEQTKIGLEQRNIDAIVEARVEPYRRKVRAQTLGSVKGAQAAAKSKKDTADSEVTAEWTKWIDSKTADRKKIDDAARKRLIAKFRGSLGRRRKERFDALLKEGRIS
jgi:hypothetical protein